MPEGDTIHHAAARIRPLLEGRVPDGLRTRHPRLERSRWPERLAGRAVTSVDAYGKHLFLRFEGGLAIHSHLRMTGLWAVEAAGSRPRRAPRRAWLTIAAAAHEITEYDGPVLELLTDARSRAATAALGPDILAGEFDERRALTRLREDDPTRPIGDALLDQRIVAGLGNLWRSEACWEARVDPRRSISAVSDEEFLELLRRTRPQIRRSALHGSRARPRRVYDRAGEPCPSCGAPIAARALGDDARTAFWCPACQR
jgi:endonuclease-8